MTEIALSVNKLVKQFGGMRVVDGVSLTIPVGERHVLLGPNGAGKTTLFNLIGGQLRPTFGQIVVLNHDMTRKTAKFRASKGVSRTFQVTSLFDDMTVRRNVCLAVRALSDVRFNMVRRADSYTSLNRRVDALLADWRFESDENTFVRDLSYGDQRKLELAMAVANQPRVLMLDEPTSGLSAGETENVVNLINGLPNDVTILVVEHDMDVAFEVADCFTVLQNGHLVMSGTAAEVRGSEEIQNIYFGETE